MDYTIEPADVLKFNNIVYDVNNSISFDLEKQSFSDPPKPFYYYSYSLLNIEHFKLMNRDPQTPQTNVIEKIRAMQHKTTAEEFTWIINRIADPIYRDRVYVAPPSEVRIETMPASEPASSEVRIETMPVSEPASSEVRFETMPVSEPPHREPPLKPPSPQKIPDKKDGIKIIPLPLLMPDPHPSMVHGTPLMVKIRETSDPFRTWEYSYYGKAGFNPKRNNEEGTLVSDKGLQIYFPSWEMNYNSIDLLKNQFTFTCTNGLKFSAKCSYDLKIREVTGIHAWGLSRISMVEIEPYIKYNIPIQELFYHALDVVDSGWGDNSRYTLDFLQWYRGPIRVVSMSHGCISAPFQLKIPKLVRIMNTPNGVRNYFDPTDVSLFELFDGDPIEFARRMVERTQTYCENLGSRHPQDDIEYNKFQTACYQKETTFNQTFLKDSKVMQRTYMGPGFAPVYVGYKSKDGGWKYVNLFAHITYILDWKYARSLTLKQILNWCSRCSECTLIDTSCAEICSDSNPPPTQMEIETMGGKRCVSRRQQRRRSKQRSQQRRRSKQRSQQRRRHVSRRIPRSSLIEKK